jgi:hypothetical protein
MNRFIHRVGVAVLTMGLVAACGGGRAESDPPETAYASSGPGGASPQSSGPSPAVAGLKIFSVSSRFSGSVNLTCAPARA